MEINGYTRIAAVVAKPIKHSLSPFIHNLAFENLDENGVYLAFEVLESDLQAVISNIKILDMYGINLSMPYKEAAISYVDELSEVAKLTAAINTIVNRDGKLFGTSTDGAGFFKSLTDFSVKDSDITIIGAGGAARAIIAEAALRGAHKITVYNRTYKPDLFKNYPGNIVFKPLSALSELAGDLLVNTTSVGMDGVSMPISQDLQLPVNMLVADVIYKPIETPLLKFAKTKGNRTINGLGMLLYQAAESFELWTGKHMPTELILQKLEEKIYE
ncbi:shikimate dehydrogenase (NADP(+)) [Lactococcus hodotermopsidis]|uniref:Shikimate dehydrogenase (NADP(+)) n=1 Tax=Pseudolactococcus hodotermopsidis TaxID=2709157 RepID=A0A6A0BB30_9LACT|nr:shikimate dehydrogenase [Lactococcus hodotermopsidis]GFH41885.1 shikimate dehydrogenase (NADP(+)) [Lactococcus hodotermopsidis]